MADEDNAEITINYETIYEILRREKGRDEIQKLEPEFFANLVEYLQNKISLLEDSKNKMDLFSSAEHAELRTQMENINRMIKELYERREKKVIMLALNKSRTGSDIIDSSNLLVEEKLFFDEIILSMDRYRKGILVKVTNGKFPDIASQCPPEQTNSSVDLPTEQNGTKLVRFLKPVPKFVGKELEVYGPFQEDDMANLPSEIANVLISKERVEEMQG